MPATLLADIAVAALVVAHGMDSDLDPRESHAMARQLSAQSEMLTGEQVSMAQLALTIEQAASQYGRMSVGDFEDLVERTGAALSPDARSAAFAVLVGVAEADGVVRTMEQTLLRHVAQAWGVTALDGNGEEAEGEEA